MERRLSAVLAADIVGYSRMMGADETGTLERVKAWRREVFDPAVAARNGRIVKLMGDGALVEFSSALDAVGCALAVQEATAAHGADAPRDRRIVLRIGVNMGDIIVEDGDIFGDGVNIAARLEGMAPPGGVLVSQTVWDSARGGIGAEFHENGARKFKKIARAIRVWSWPEKLPSARADAKPRVHVAALAGESAAERRLADDLGDELRAHLARLTGLEVAAAAAGADYRVEGGVRLGIGRCRVHGRLIAAESDRQVWAERYDEATDDPFAIVDACAPRLVMSVRRQVAADDAARLRDRPLDELSVNELLALAGVSFFNPTRDGWRGGGVIAEQALQIAPDNFMALAMAAAGLGLAERVYGYRAAAPEELDLAFARVEEALRRNSRSDMLHATHSGLLLYGRARHREAEAAARRSIEVNPDYNMGWWTLGGAQIFAGDPEAGARAAERAVVLNPADPYVHLYSRTAGYGHLGAGRLDEAVDWLRRADQLAPGIAPNLMALTVAARRAGDAEGAADALDRLMRAEPAFRVAEAAPLPYRDPAAWPTFAATLREAGAPA